MGIRIVREDVAQFISKRDGYPADPEDVIITAGGAQGIRVRKRISVRMCTISVL